MNYTSFPQAKRPESITFGEFGISLRMGYGCIVILASGINFNRV